MGPTLGRFAVPLVAFVILIGIGIGGEDLLSYWQHRWFGADSLALSRIVGTCIWLVGAMLAIRLTRAIVWDGLVARRGGAPVPKMVTQLSALVILLLALTGIVAFVFEESVAGLVTTSGAVGLLLGFAARSLIMDLFSGISINLERPFTVGEFIQITGRGPAIFGRVEEITMRTTRLLTPEGSMQIVPNGMIGEAIILNVSRPTPIGEFETTILLDHEVPTERARRVLQAGLQQAVASPAGPLAKPEPTVRISQVQDSGILYKLKYHIDPRRGGPGKVRNTVLECVLNHLSRAGLHPAYRKQQGISIAPTPPQPDDERLEALVASSPSLQGLDRTAASAFGRALTRRFVAPGEVIVTVGDTRRGLYFLEEGFLTVTMPVGNGSGDAPVGHVAPGEFFVGVSGDDGAASGVTITAGGEAIVLALEDAGVEDLLSRHADLRLAVAHVAERANEERRERLKSYLAEQSDKVRVSEKAKLFSQLAGRMRTMFSGRSGGALGKLLFMGAERRNRQLIDGAMAACALIAAADGSVDPEERQQAIASFEELGMFRHVDAGEAIARFDAHVSTLLADPVQAHAELLGLIAKLRGDRRSAELIVSICRAVSSADGVVDENETKRIGEVALALGLPEANTGHFDEAYS